MANRVEGKICFVTGAARGQGRSHAVRLAEEGADIIAVDLAGPIASVPYDLGTAGDLAQTVEEVEALGRKIVASKADVRDAGALQAALDDGVARLGGLDIVCANAGVFGTGRLADLDDAAWDDMHDVNLKGVWHTIKVSIPHLRARGGGSIILTGSTGGQRAMENVGHYVAAKHGVVGLMRTAALELGPDNIRVNVVHPTTVDTGMIQNRATYDVVAADLPEAARTREAVAPRFQSMHTLPVPWVEPRDVSNAVLWLASAESRWVTGSEVRVDAGQVIKHS
ncbi:mycofactocin-coupled SDR family oxidoreductase [Amycolatopsis jejuensis]|uniref:mycofactocin-coupled SDR family oxidoreductase n=1 Tax=Amycolatopsis jejuensis TaxID=330084 RepID=UPI000524A059|nr:mycofactocin-coupled SDR family oxidoreductase [Amycolatopsis jejuensis]